MGLFRSEDRAQAMQERLRISGFAANIYPRPRYRDEAWIALDEPTRMALGWPDQGGELPGYEGITLRPRECP